MTLSPRQLWTVDPTGHFTPKHISPPNWDISHVRLVVVEADTINILKNRLDKHWINQEVLFNFNADLTGSEVYQFVCELDCKMRAKRIPPAPVISHWIGLRYAATCINQRLLSKSAMAADVWVE